MQSVLHGHGLPFPGDPSYATFTSMLFDFSPRLQEDAIATAIRTSQILRFTRQL